MSDNTSHLNADVPNEGKVPTEEVPANVADGRGGDGVSEDDGSMECHSVAQDGVAQGQGDGGEPRNFPEHAGGVADAEAPAQPADEDDEHDVGDVDARHLRDGEELEGAHVYDDGDSSDGLEGVTDELEKLDLDGPGNLSRTAYDHLGHSPQARLTETEAGLEGYKLIGHIVARCVRFCTAVKDDKQKDNEYWKEELEHLWEAIWAFRHELRDLKDDLKRTSEDCNEGHGELAKRLKSCEDRTKSALRSCKECTNEVTSIRALYKHRIPEKRFDEFFEGIGGLKIRVENMEQRLDALKEAKAQRADIHDNAAGVAMVFTTPDGKEHVELLHYDKDGKLPGDAEVEREYRDRILRRHRADRRKGKKE